MRVPLVSDVRGGRALSGPACETQDQALGRRRDHPSEHRRLDLHGRAVTAVQESAARDPRGDARGDRGSEHVHGLLITAYPKTQCLRDVGAHVRAQGALGTLGREHEVHTQGTTHRGNHRELLPRVREGIREHPGLVHHDHEFPEGGRGARRAQQLRHVVESEGGQDTLTTLYVGVQERQGTAHLVRPQIGQQRRDVGQTGQRGQRRPSFEVDEHEFQAVRWELVRQCRGDGAQYLRFSAARGARDEEVRVLVVESDDLQPRGRDAERRRQSRGRRCGFGMSEGPATVRTDERGSSRSRGCGQ